jgi:hypothetical protein
MNRQLRAGTCISHAVSSVRNNLGYAFRISWPWYAAMAPIIIALVLLSFYLSGGNPENKPGPTAVIDMIRGLITMVAFASIAVNWHRYILLDEVPGSREIFRLDNKTWRYFGNVLLLILILIVIGLVIGFPIGAIGGLSGSPVAAIVFTILLVLPVAGVVTLRLGTKFPAIALGRSDFSMQNAWAATAGNNLQIFLVILFEFCVALLIVVAISAIAYLTNMVNPTLSIIVTVILGLALNWLLTIFSITVLTSLYGFFVEGRDF